jgi:ribose-phosphate pyrophosphokinase
MDTPLKLLTGNANRPLAQEICKNLGIELCQADVSRFPDGETNVYIQETVRGDDLFVIQPTSPPVNEHLMELLLIIDALRRASARQITAVIPYYGYGRQDRKHIGRVPISARLVANLIETAGADRVLTLDLSAGQIQGFFNIPVDNLRADPLMAEQLTSRNGSTEEMVIVAPDIGSAKRSRELANRLDASLAIVEKSRFDGQEVKAHTLIGEVKGKRAIIVDDILATGGTLVEAAELLLRNGAREVQAAITHGVFAGDALARIEESSLTRVMVTNTIAPPPEARKSTKVEWISVGDLFSKAIERIHEERSVSQLIAHS